jgi:hypothetical protein
MGLDTKTYWLTDCQSQCDFDFDLTNNESREKKNKNLDTEQIYGHGLQRGSMPRVTVLAVCQQ